MVSWEYLEVWWEWHDIYVFPSKKLLDIDIEWVKTTCTKYELKRLEMDTRWRGRGLGSPAILWISRVDANAPYVGFELLEYLGSKGWEILQVASYSEHTDNQARDFQHFWLKKPKD